MSLTVKNRLAQLKNAVEKIADEKHRQGLMERAGTQAGHKVLGLLRIAAPKGKTEPSFTAPSGRTISHGRPSERLGHGTLDSQWGAPTVETIDNGARVIVTSSAPHMQLLLEGAPHHPIPRTGEANLIFWIIEGNRRFVGRRLPNGHPGFPPATFVDEAINKRGGRRIILENFSLFTREVLSPIRTFFS